MMRRTARVALVLVLATALLSSVAAAADVADPRDVSAVAGSSGGGEIVGGEPVSIANRPFQVAFFPGSSICGASLIHPSYLLTAAHCVDNLASSSSVAARFGSGTWQSGGTVRTGTKGGGGQIESVEVHSSWNDFTSENDLALVALDAPMPSSTNVQTVRIIEPGMEAQWAAGVPSIVSGWGTTSSGGVLATQLRQVQVPIVSGTYCGSGSSYGSSYKPASMVCAGVVAGGKDSCQGDSGGPLTVGGAGGPFQIGVVSWGFECATPGFPGVYTRVSSYGAWLRARVPLSDRFADAYLLDGTTPEIGSSTHATRESGEPVVAGATESSIWYRCVASATGTHTVDTNGSSMDTVLGIYTGTTLGDLTMVASDDDGGTSGGTSAVSFAAEEGTTYKIQVASFDASEGTTVLNRSLPCHRETFTDAGRYATFFEDIEWLAGNGITTGFPDGTFRPVAQASRQALVAYLYRLAGEPAGPFPDPGFSDVEPSHPFATEIAWGADAGVVGGFIDGTFKPTSTVSRQALVSFLHGLAGEPAGPFPDPGFSDVGPSHPFATEIAWAADAGVVGGYADGTFRPGAAISRQAIAALLHRYALLGA